jgi:hypothetical protein
MLVSQTTAVIGICLLAALVVIFIISFIRAFREFGHNHSHKRRIHSVKRSHEEVKEIMR